jgi:hypothetical protein
MANSSRGGGRSRSQSDAQNSRISGLDVDTVEVTSKEGIEKLDERMAILLKLKVLLRLGMKNAEANRKANNDDRR